MLAAVAAVVLLAGCTADHPRASTTTVTTAVPPTTLGAVDTFHLRTPGVLVVGTEEMNPPWYIGGGPDTVTSGFEHDLAEALATDLQVPRVRFVQVPLVDLLSGEDCGCDLMLTQALVTEERAKAVDFTEPYLNVGEAALVRTSAPFASLVGARSLQWALPLRDTAAGDILRRVVQPLDPPQTVVNVDEGVRRLEAGEIDALMVDTPTALSLAAGDTSLTVVGQFHTDQQYAGVLPLGSPNTALVDDAIRAERARGTLDTLARIYFGTVPADVPLIQ